MHASLLHGLDQVDELVIGDVDVPRAEQLAATLDGTRAGDPATVIATCDALVIAAASDAHAPLVRAAIPRGIPVFCEKPLAATLGETIDLAREIEASGIAFQLGFQRRFDAGYREARRRLASGELGTLYVVRLAGHDPAPPHEAYIPASGGLFRDFSVHDFDVIRWLTGLEVEEVYADGGVLGFPMFAKYNDVDTAVATLRMAGGPLVAMTVSRHDPLGYDIRAELFGSRDSISVGLGPHTPMRSVEPGVAPPEGPAWSAFQNRFAQAYRDELLGFMDLASGKVAASPCTARDGVEALRIAEAATRSMQEHRPVRLAEIDG
jgi:myo-inositol 2-dehydrogenase/D-chiro-inositol 1-dehydrogenase